jgi:hypothetical protein
MKLPELKSLMKEHKIKGSSHMNKPEIIAVLHDRGIIFEDSVRKQDAPVKRNIGPKYEFLGSIRTNPKSVEIRDLETGDITTYSSIYKASRAIGRSTKFIMGNNGKVWKNKYEIKIIELQ